MSALTKEWQVRTEDGIEYTVCIEDFAKKMKTYGTGKRIFSRTFYIGECSFKIHIYPNGSSIENRDNISVFLYNMSGWSVWADCKLSVKDYCVNLDKHLYSISGNWGRPKFISHDDCDDEELLDDNKTFVLKAEIKLSEEEVTVDRKLSSNSVVVMRGDKKDCLEEIRKLKTEIHNMKTRDCLEVVRNNNKECVEEIKKLKILVQNTNTEMDNLRRSVETIKMSNQTEGHIPTPECPVCLEAVRRPMRLIQCGMGHILCDGCYQKSREEACRREEGERDMGRCHICMGEYTGRPAVLEKILGLLD